MSGRPRVTPPSTRSETSILEDIVAPRSPEPDPAPAAVVEIREVVREIVVDSLPALEAIPLGVAPDDEDAELSAQELDDRATCEQAIAAAQETSRRAFWVVGKALQAIRDGRWYRKEFDTFEAYTQQRWDLSPRHANRLIEGWPVAELVTPIGSAKPTESQVRELVPVARNHGDQAVVQVWTEAQKAQRVTAAVLAAVRDELGYGTAGSQPTSLASPESEAVRARTKALAKAVGRPVTRAEVVRHLLDVLAADDTLYTQLLGRLKTAAADPPA